MGCHLERKLPITSIQGVKTLQGDGENAFKTGFFPIGHNLQGDKTTGGSLASCLPSMRECAWNFWSVRGNVCCDN